MEPNMNLNISLDQTSEVICAKCNNNTFNDSFLLRKVSRLLTGNLQDGLIPISVFSCTKCSHVNEEFLPPQLRIDVAEEVK